MDKNPINEAFGKAVAQRRDELGMTQGELAGLVGMARASIANIERGRQNVLLHHIYALAGALGMTKVGDLLPARPKAGADPLPVSATSGDISAREAANISDVVARAYAAHLAKASS